MFGSRNLRRSKHEHDSHTQALLERHLKFEDWIDGEDEKDDIERHASAIQRHLKVVVVPVVEVLLPFQWMPCFIQRPADEDGQHGVDDQVNSLQSQEEPYHVLDARLGGREDALVEEEDRYADRDRHGWIKPRGSYDTLKRSMSTLTVSIILSAIGYGHSMTRERRHTLNQTENSPMVISHSGLPTPA